MATITLTLIDIKDVITDKDPGKNSSISVLFQLADYYIAEESESKPYSNLIEFNQEFSFRVKNPLIDSLLIGIFIKSESNNFGFDLYPISNTKIKLITLKNKTETEGGFFPLFSYTGNQIKENGKIHLFIKYKETPLIITKSSLLDNIVPLSDRVQNFEQPDLTELNEKYKDNTIASTNNYQKNFIKNEMKPNNLTDLNEPLKEEEEEINDEDEEEEEETNESNESNGEKTTKKRKRVRNPAKFSKAETNYDISFIKSRKPLKKRNQYQRRDPELIRVGVKQTVNKRLLEQKENSQNQQIKKLKIDPEKLEHFTKYMSVMAKNESILKVAKTEGNMIDDRVLNTEISAVTMRTIHNSIEMTKELILTIKKEPTDKPKGKPHIPILMPKETARPPSQQSRKSTGSRQSNGSNH